MFISVSPVPCSFLLFSHLVMSYSLRCHGLQHDRLPCLFTISWSLLKLMSVESVRPSNHLFHSCPLLLPPAIIPSIRIFSNESVLCNRWPKYWSFSFISPSNEYSGLSSFRIDWFDLLAVRENSRVLPNTTVQKHQFFHAQRFLWSNSHI